MLHDPNRSILPLSGIDRRLVGCVIDSVWRTNGKSVTQGLLMSLDVCGNRSPSGSSTTLFSFVNSVYSKPDDIFVLI